MARTPAPKPKEDHRRRGFEPAFALVSGQVRHAGEARGFAIARLVTHWPEVVGDDIAAVTRPVKVGYGREGLGATLTLLVQGAAAPVVEMRKQAIRDRVNAVYGYNAIARVVLTQTSASGFAEGQAQFSGAPKAAKAPDPALALRATETAAGVGDPGLRAALEQLAQNVFSRAETEKKG